MLSSPGTGLERVGLKRNTSIIEKLTNLTYSTVGREDDTRLINCLASQEQDISPLDDHGQSDKGSPTKRKRGSKRKKATNTSSSAYGESDQSPTLEINSKLSSSQSDTASCP
mmetsp:Transcript_5227/g.6402  ORF Transcript_5227/g.6402 Transcript_5227/m.6402 type:complete len:112 (+) Transcript_5227:1481-1816(+)|eukprot:CAMPEP_0170452580 /NCGR_PEP_ID=MMETSP0123-20130129/1428_1 /TAXON_ID=182087 /ORGANISM="Favella ehrenbergii, Strain Fehren 1" /LENGTH=111 /DNA_ID=CAMNT_0010714627 /DNA_START=1411 /DNA_END=1746 /DNA_ORIENTATION=+